MQFWTYLKGSYTIKNQTYQRGQKVVGACRIHTNMWEDLPRFDDICRVIWPPKSIIPGVPESLFHYRWCMSMFVSFDGVFNEFSFFIFFSFFHSLLPLNFVAFFFLSLSTDFFPYLSITIPWFSIPWKTGKTLTTLCKIKLKKTGRIVFSLRNRHQAWGNKL